MKRFTHDRAIVLGCAIDRIGLSETVRRCEESIINREHLQQVSINALKVVMLRRDAALRDIVAKAGLVSPDGVPIVWASRLLGDPLPERVNGTDLMYRLFALSEEKGYRPYILGATQDVLDRAADCLRRLHPNLSLAGSQHGFFGEEESAVICDEIRRAEPDILFIAMGSPRKELWMGRHGAELGVPLVMGVGGSVDILAGVTRRAPQWMQRNGLEWLFRLGQEPRRLAIRYTLGNLRFVMLLASALVRRAFRTSR
jgi:N-acetylglucosaminyldiphosphoundecaprenol N-acetyl-beta-D-mannosaminyltransferase